MGVHNIGYLTPGLIAAAAAIDARYEGLRLGFVDASVMAIADRHDLAVLTFDFRHFRATESSRGPWRLVVDEEMFRRITGL